MTNTTLFKKKISIASLLVTVLVVFSVIGTFTMVVLSRGYSESALHSLANGIIDRSIHDSIEHINMVIKPAVASVEFIEAKIPETAEVSKDESYNDDIVKTMIKMLQVHKDVYTVYYANEMSEFFLVGKRQRFEDNKKIYFFHKRITFSDGIKKVTETWYDGHKKLDTVDLKTDSYNPKLRPWYSKAQNDKQGVWTDPYIFFITKMPGITYAKPIMASGSFKGVVAADLEINTLSNLMVDSAFTKNTQIFAVNADNKIIAHSGIDKVYKSNTQLFEKVPDINGFGDQVVREMVLTFDRDPADSVIDLNVGGERYKSMMLPVEIRGLKLKLGMYTPSQDYLMPLYDSYKTLFIVAVFILAAVLIVSKYVSYHLGRPFKELSEATELVKDLEFDKPVNIHTSFKEVYLTQNNFNEMLESLKNYQSANELLSETLHNAHIDTLYRLAMAAEHKDQYTYDHLKRVSDISVMIADILGMSQHDIELIRHASAMHDVGKLGIPDNILMKPGKLTVDEYDIIKTHSRLGAKILENPSSEEMHASQIIALSHHEKWDGSGYPFKLSGEDIPLNGRIVSIADVTDALLSKRPYKEPFSFNKTIEIIEFERGRHFDPELVDLVLENKKTLLKLVG